MRTTNVMTRAILRMFLWMRAKLHEREGSERDYWIAVVEADERNVGLAFAQSLMPGLPMGLAGLLDLPPTGGRMRRYLERDISVVAAGPAGMALARVGLTPVHVARAMFVISCLAGRKECGDRPVTLSCLADGEADVTQAEIADELMLNCDLPRHLASALGTWVVLVAGYARRVFPDYVAERKGDHVVLTREDRGDGDLASAWAR